MFHSSKMEGFTTEEAKRGSDILADNAVKSLIIIVVVTVRIKPSALFLIYKIT